MKCDNSPRGGKKDRRGGRESEFKFLFRVSSSSNERPLNSESLIMSVLIIKKGIAGDKPAEITLSDFTAEERGGEQRSLTVYFHDP